MSLRNDCECVRQALMGKTLKELSLVTGVCQSVVSERIAKTLRRVHDHHSDQPESHRLGRVRLVEARRSSYLWLPALQAYRDYLESTLT